MDRARLAVTLALALASSPAHAHGEKFPKRDRLELSPSAARVIVEYMVSGDEARALRSLFDRDHSGALDPRERAQLGDYLAQQAARFVTLTIDGTAIPLSRAAMDPSLATDLAVTLTLSAPLALTAGDHHIRFADRHKDRRVDVPVTVTLDALRASHLDPQPFVFATRALDFTVTR